MSRHGYLPGMLLALSALGFAGAMEGHRWFVWDPSALLVVIVGSAGLLVATFGVQQVLEAFRVASRPQESSTPEERARAQMVLSAAMRYPCGLGAIACLYGFLAMLRNLQDAAQVGPAMAFSFLGALYAVFLSEVLVAPLWFRVAAVKGEASAPQASAKPPVPIAPIASVLLCSVMMLALLVSLRFGRA